MGTPHYFDQHAHLWAFAVSPWFYDPNNDAVSGAAFPQCYPISLSGLPPKSAPSACATVLKGQENVGGNFCRDQPAGGKTATQAECCAACDKNVYCEVWRYDTADTTCVMLFGVSSYHAAKVSTVSIGGNGVAPPPSPPTGQSHTIWTALGQSADFYLAPLAAFADSPTKEAPHAPSIGDDAIVALYDLTGYPSMPPLYAFGFMACYWGYVSHFLSFLSRLF